MRPKLFCLEAVEDEDINGLAPPSTGSDFSLENPRSSDTRILGKERKLMTAPSQSGQEGDVPDGPTHSVCSLHG